MIIALNLNPLGFALENFDAIGAWREKYDKKLEDDSSGKLPNGQTFSSVDEFRKLVVAREETFTRCLTKKLLTYSTGRHSIVATARVSTKSIRQWPVLKKAFGILYIRSCLVIPSDIIRCFPSLSLVQFDPRFIRVIIEQPRFGNALFGEVTPTVN